MVLKPGSSCISCCFALGILAPLCSGSVTDTMWLKSSKKATPLNGAEPLPSNQGTLDPCSPCGRGTVPSRPCTWPKVISRFGCRPLTLPRVYRHYPTGGDRNWRTSYRTCRNIMIFQCSKPKFEARLVCLFSLKRGKRDLRTSTLSFRKSFGKSFGKRHWRWIGCTMTNTKRLNVCQLVRSTRFIYFIYSVGGECCSLVAHRVSWKQCFERQSLVTVDLTLALMQTLRTKSRRLRNRF